MFKQICYKAVVKNGEGYKIFPVLRMYFNQTGVYQVDVPKEGGDPEKDLVSIPIDFMNIFLQENTGKFDKNGKMLFSSDIIKTKKKIIGKWKNDPVVGEEDIYFQIAFVDGGFVGLSEINEVFISLDEKLCLQSEYVGNSFENSDLITLPVKADEVFKENNEKENSN